MRSLEWSVYGNRRWITFQPHASITPLSRVNLWISIEFSFVSSSFWPMNALHHFPVRQLLGCVGIGTYWSRPASTNKAMLTSAPIAPRTLRLINQLLMQLSKLIAWSLNETYSYAPHFYGVQSEQQRIEWEKLDRILLAEGKEIPPSQFTRHHMMHLAAMTPKQPMMMQQTTQCILVLIPIGNASHLASSS